MAAYQAVTPMEPPTYDPSSIKRVRPPEVEGEVGRWHATWQLTIARPITVETLRVIEAEVSAATGVEINLALISDSSVRLETITGVHPLEVEAWPVVDSMLVALDRLLDLVEINDCPRGWWRPFR